MHSSRVNAKYRFDSNHWVVSIINASHPNPQARECVETGGHAILVVEGEDAIHGISLGDGQPPVFVGFYDICSATIGQPEGTYNPKGSLYVKHKDTEDVAKHDEIRRVYDLYRDNFYPHHIYDHVSMTDARRMIAAIRSEAAQWNSRGGQPYQRWGARGWFVKSSNGHNCMGWCEKHIKTAVPDYELRGTKAKPPKAPCTIL